MSYALEFVRDARAAWGVLDVELQEAIVDELERIAATEPSSKQRWMHDLVVELQGVRHYFFFELRAWVQSGTLKVYRIGHFSRPSRQ